MRHPRILNRAAQAYEPKVLEEGTLPRFGPTGSQTRSCALEKQPAESPFDILVDVSEVVRRIARAKVLSPPAEHRIEIRNDDAEVRVAPPAGSQRSHTSAHPRHGALGRPAMQVEDALSRPLPNRTAHALAQMTAEKVEPLATAREIDQSRLLRMELEPRAA